MAYIGQQPVVGRYILLDQISGGFNGTTSGFTMSTAGGVQGVNPGLAQNVLLSLGGVIQQPGVDYTISGSGITFTTPPVSGTTFFATVLGDAQSVGTPSDGTVTPASIASGFDFGFPNVNVTGVITIASGVAATPSLSITGDTDTGLFSPSADTLGFATAGVQRLSIETGEVVVNDGSSDVDFRVESNGQAHMLFVDGGNDRIGIGKSTPRSAFELGIGHIVVPALGRIGTGGSGDTPETAFRFASADNITAIVGNSEKLRIDNSGRLLVGTTSSSVASSAIFEGNSSNASGAGVIYLNRGTGSMSAGLEMGFIRFGDQDENVGAFIEAEADGTWASDDYPGRILLATTADGASSPTERMRIDQAGRVGIGATPGSQEQLLVHGGDSSIHVPIARSDSKFITIHSGGTDPAIYCDTGGSIRFGHGSSRNSFTTERMRIDSSGRLLLGATSSAGAGRKFQIAGTDANGASMSICRNTNNNDGVTIDYIKSRNGTYGSSTIVQSGDVIAKIQFRGDDGTDYISQAASILAAVDGTPGTNDMPGRLVFSTTADGASTPTERMRIDRSGRLLIGTTSARSLDSATQLLQVEAEDGSGSGRIAIGTNNNDNGTGAGVYLFRSRGGALGSNTVVQNNDDLGSIYFHGADGNDLNSRAAQIRCEVEGTPGSNDMPGRLMFSTTADGASSPTERLRIDSSGRVGIGTSSPGSKLHIQDTVQATANGHNQITITGDDSGTVGESARIYLSAINATNRGCGIISERTSSSNAHALIFQTNSDSAVPAERMRIDSSGDVGIGTTSPDAKLQLVPPAVDTNIFSIRRQDHASINLFRFFQDSNVSQGTGCAHLNTSNRDLIITASSGAGIDDGIYLETTGEVGINHSSPQFGLTLGQTSTNLGKIGWEDTGNSKRASITCSTSSDALQFHTGTSDNERMRITSNGSVRIGKTSSLLGDTGHVFDANGVVNHTRSAGTVVSINRTSNDGTLVNFYQATSVEGSISVSGSTVSYNGGHLARWSQLENGAERTEILRGSVLSNLDEMCEWGEENNEQLNRMKVSDVEGDVNVAGVFQAWDDDDDTYTNDFYCAMTGDFVIRIAQGTTVARGDLLMSAGDGTAKPQDDDIVRSKTIAKVTSTTVSTTYADGSYCVPCVLMAC